MKPFRPGQWGSQLRPFCCRHSCPLLRPSTSHYSIRHESSAAIQVEKDDNPVKRKRGRPRKSELQETKASFVTAMPKSSSDVPIPPPTASSPSRAPSIQPHPSQQIEISPSTPPERTSIPLEELPSPPVSAAQSSAKLSALHARLALPTRLPLETLARTLVDETADPDIRFNNSSLAELGNDLIGYWMGEHILVNYPRLPLVVMYAAQSAYVGPKGLAALAEEWGIEVAAVPGGEVDPGLLQFRRAPPGMPLPDPGKGTRPDKYVHWRRGVSSRVIYDDQFGELYRPATQRNNSDSDQELRVNTLMTASTNFVRALFGAIYLHAGAAKAYDFFTNHILSRKLDLSSLFTFSQPTRDLSRLCAREGFESPVARLLSETGRLSRTPVFVVGVFSGRDKLGEAAGANLNEARWKAAAKALKGWYLYSPAGVNAGGSVMVPSATERDKSISEFKPAVIDRGEVVV